MSEEIRKTIEWFNNHVEKNGFLMSSHSITIKKIVTDLKALAEICEPSKNFSIDTYAKKLKISGRKKEYLKLKDTLTLFFTLQQKRKFPDVRYDNFWASLLDTKDEFPQNINILSWNYDFQFELTFQDFIQADSLKSTAKVLNLITPKSSTSRYQHINAFQIFKLNGSATYNSEIGVNDEKYLINDLKDCSIANALEKVFNYYSIRNVEITNHLSYAWEHDLSDKFFVHLISSILRTNILVIIGYSFPFFNRLIDKQILRSMTSLKTVYIQDPNAHIIKERFLAIREVTTINLVSDSYQFVLPNEL